MKAMTILKFEPAKECNFLRVKIARDMQERMERYRVFCDGLELAGLGEHTLVNVVDKDVDCRARDKVGAATPAKGEPQWFVKWVSPADKTGGAP